MTRRRPRFRRAVIGCDARGDAAAPTSFLKEEPNMSITKKNCFLATAILSVAVPIHAADAPAKPAAAPAKAAAAAPAPAPAAPAHIMMAAKEVKWGDCPPFLAKGAQCAVLSGDPSKAGGEYTIRAKMPDKYKIPPHTHPGDEHVTVVAGTFELGMGEKWDAKALKGLNAGGYFSMPKGMAHFAMAKGETIVQVHGVGPVDFNYIDPKDDPRKK